MPRNCSILAYIISGQICLMNPKIHSYWVSNQLAKNPFSHRASLIIENTIFFFFLEKPTKSLYWNLTATISLNYI